MRQPTLSNLVPRSVPLFVRLRLFIGGALMPVLWAVFGFLMVFFWGFGADETLVSAFRFRGRVKTVPGVVMAHRLARVEVGHSKVHTIDYRFTTPDNHTFSGHSYGMGRYVETGTPVTVEFIESNPHVSRIRGMDTSPLGNWGWLLILVSSIPVPFFIASMLRGLRRIRLLRDGTTTRGTLRSTQPVDAYVGGPQAGEMVQVQMIFDYRSADGQSHAIAVRTHRMGNPPEGAERLLVYDPMNPDRAAVLDALPGRPCIDETGLIYLRDLRSAVFAILVPAAILAIHGAWALHRWLA